MVDRCGVGLISVGFENPNVSWRDFERRLSDGSHRSEEGRELENGNAFEPASVDMGLAGSGGGKRTLWPTSGREDGGLGQVPYAELHCHSNFSFLDGASHPEELVTEAVRRGLSALALTDHNGLYGVVRFAEAARMVGLPTVFGAELTIGSRVVSENRNGPADPAGEHLVVLARDPEGYARLSRVIGEGQLAGEKGAPQIPYERLVDLGGRGTGDHWLVLTGCRKGRVPAALVTTGIEQAGDELDILSTDFGRQNVVVELWDHGLPGDSVRNDGLWSLAQAAGVDVVASGNVHHHSVARARLASALAAVRSRRSLDEIDGWLPPAGRHLRSGAEQASRFRRYPGVVERAAALGLECAFDLALVAPNLPPYPCPDGLNEMEYLRRLVEDYGSRRYGSRTNERVPGAWRQLDHELDLIETLGFAGYFLIVWDIVEFCRRSDILCQGRGSAANSAVCYALNITNADAVSLGLLFERFLSPERDGPPDIDIDIESDRREEVIQYVYQRHGRHHCAQVANVITYRSRSAIRDMAKALGYATGQQDAFSKQADRWQSLARIGEEEDINIPTPVLELASAVEHFPRHLGIHSGGMVMCDRPVIEVCPVEWGRMENRSVLQWDKDDCAAAGLVKFDLLGLGMLSVLHYAIDLITENHEVTLDLATLPQEDAVYEMLQRADSIGVFQVESRAQMATLPRLKPRCFYDLVVEVALIRPGPIQGGSVHPYIRRRNGQEPVTYLHPLLENALEKTLGVPLFQEQLMQIAIDVAGFTPAEADQLRQAVGSKRSQERMAQLRERFFAGMRANGIGDDVGQEIWLKLAAFANYGFPESHSVAFSYLVYASAWIKYHYPAAFCAALLNAQPMGFWSPHTLVGDARRHGVVVMTPDVNRSAAAASLEPCEHSTGGRAVRLGIGSVKGIGDDLAEAIAAGRPYVDVEDLRRRMPSLSLPMLEALATAGAFGCFGTDRREALWTAGAVAQTSADRLPGMVTGAHAPSLPGMSDWERAAADMWATGIAPDGHPTQFLRRELASRGVVSAVDLPQCVDGSRVLVAGVVTHRQRPSTAGGTSFLNLEDETGLVNVVVSRGCWKRYRPVARSASALLVRGRLERQGEVCNVIAEAFEALSVGPTPGSRDFR